MTDPSQDVIPLKDWMKRSNLKFFTRNMMETMVPGVARVGRGEPFEAMRRHYEVVSRDAHYIHLSTRIILTDRLTRRLYEPAELLAAEEAIIAQMDRVHDYLTMRIQQAAQKLVHVGFDPASVARIQLAYEAPRSTPTARRYIQLVEKADEYQGMLDYLWIVGALGATEAECQRAKLNSEREMRHQLYSLPRKTAEHFQVLRRICNAVLDERTVPRLLQAERDRRNHAARVAGEQAAAAAAAAQASAGEAGRSPRDIERAFAAAGAAT